MLKLSLSWLVCESTRISVAPLKVVCDCSFPRAVLFASSLMRGAVATRAKVTVVYATETGKSETLANNLCSLFSCAFSTKVSSTNQPHHVETGAWLLQAFPLSKPVF